jgi:hypothetical protein
MSRYTGPAMDLQNMRSLGVTRIMAYCKCGHEASIDVSGLPAEVFVPEIRNRLRCSLCDERPMETRPDWRQYHVTGKMKR